MDSRDGETILDTAEVEQQHEPTTHVLIPHQNIEELEVRCQELDGNRVSVDNYAVASAIGSNDAKRGDQEEQSSADPLVSSIPDESKGNSFQGKDSHAAGNVSSHNADVENLHNLTMVGERDLQGTVCSDNAAIENICGILDNLPTEVTLEHAITLTVERGNKEVIVNLPGILRPVRSLRDLSINKISRLGWPRRKTRNSLSESELQRCGISATQNLFQHLRSENIGHEADSSETLVLGPEPSNISHIRVEDTPVVAETQTGVEESGEDGERKAFFYISSSSIPGMGNGSEQSSVSGRCQRPTRLVRRIIRRERREPFTCLGTQKCHYMVIFTALLTAAIGCIVYHMSNSGIGPGVLRPIGASTAFISLAVCIFSSIYIGYLKNYSQLIQVTPHFELLGDVDSVMAMNRTSDPEFVYCEDGHYNAETRSADILDREGYGRQQAESQTDVKRYAEESGTAYSTQPQKKFKGQTDVPAESDVPVESVQVTDLGSDEPSEGQEPVQKFPEGEDPDKED